MDAAYEPDAEIDVFKLLNHMVFHTVFSMLIILLFAKKLRQSLFRVVLPRDSIIQVYLVILIALACKFVILISLPLLLMGLATVNWWGLLLLAISPQLALLAQLGLSRVREFDADHTAARLTGDPEGLASALAKVERISRSWRNWLMPGWGNPEPSWLRTHPAIQARIARLLELVPPQQVALRSAPKYFTPSPVVVSRSPRWYPGGFWR